MSYDSSCSEIRFIRYRYGRGIASVRSELGGCAGCEMRNANKPDGWMGMRPQRYTARVKVLFKDFPSFELLQRVE
jgi:hypothetical protein